MRTETDPGAKVREIYLCTRRRIIAASSSRSLSGCLNHVMGMGCGSMSQRQKKRSTSDCVA